MDDKIAKSIRKLNRLIAKEWRAIEPELKRCLKIGHYESERLLRSRATERQRELVRQWEEFRLTLLPFMTKEKGYYVRHPVTPENQHLLRPIG
jgi:hypothetical protein